MADSTNVQNSKLTKEHRKLIYDCLATNIIRFQEYRLDVIKPDGAVLFEYLCYNSFKLFIEDRSTNGFFYHSYERIGQEYGIGKDRVRKVIGILKQMGIVETKICGFPKNTHYRVRFDNLALIEVLIKLFRTTPDRTKEIATHYKQIATLVNLREETTDELLDKQFPSGYSWFNVLKRTFYQERDRFNNTVSREAASRKIQPKPRETTLISIEREVMTVYYDDQGNERSDQQTDERQRNYIDAFRLYCALYFVFTCNERSSSAELNALSKKDYGDILVNYATGIRDPIAYFFAEHEGGANRMIPDFIKGASFIDFTSGYFNSKGSSH